MFCLAQDGSKTCCVYGCSLAAEVGLCHGLCTYVRMSVHIASVVGKVLFSAGGCTAEGRSTVGWWGGILY